MGDGGPQSFNDLDSNEAQAILVASLSRLASFSTGAVKTDEDGRHPYYSGRYLDRPFKVTVDSDGLPELTVRIKNPGGWLSVYFDPEARPVAADPDWDEGKLKVFLGPGVTIEGDKDEIAEAQAIMGATLPGLFAAALPQIAARSVAIRDDEIEVWYMMGDVDILRRELAGWMQMSLDFCAQVCRALSF